MKVFVTGATGFVGTAVVEELKGAGHSVLGLARNDAAGGRLETAGIDVHRGDLCDAESLAAGARASDGVIHTAFVHDFSNMPAAGETDRRAIEAMGAALEGSGKPLVVTSGTAHLAGDRVATEDEMPDANVPVRHRVASEETAMALASRGVRSMLLRLPPSVHGDGDHGFVPFLIGIAREKGVSAFIGDGNNRWPAVHRLDAARLFRLALETGTAGGRYHAVGDQGIPFREIAVAIGRGLGVPAGAVPAEDAADHFGWLAAFAGMNRPASSALTQQRLGWHPMQVSLIEDLDRGTYFTPRDLPLAR